VAATSISIDELRPRLDILEVIGQYVHLNKAGTEYRGRCPFHDEKTPSFFVNAEKGVWFCRGACGVGGDVFKFVMLAEKLEFVEALNCWPQAGPDAGIALAAGGDETARASRRIVSAVAEVYQRSLLTAEGGEWRGVPGRRGLSEESSPVSLGYARRAGTI